jgi:hypothetical protein
VIGSHFTRKRTRNALFSRVKVELHRKTAQPTEGISSEQE